MLDAGCRHCEDEGRSRMLDAGYWMLDVVTARTKDEAGCWILDAGCRHSEDEGRSRILDAGCRHCEDEGRSRILDAGYWQEDYDRCCRKSEI